MNKMLLLVAATAAIVLGGCTPTASNDPADIGVTPESRALPTTVSSSPSTEPTFEYTPPPPPPPPPPVAPPPPMPEPRALPDPPEPAPQDECDPNYEGACVPVASDVDCLGGSGNGPAYVQGPVRVASSDIYGLDGADNDGVGCE